MTDDFSYQFHDFEIVYLRIIVLVAWSLSDYDSCDLGFFCVCAFIRVCVCVFVCVCRSGKKGMDVRRLSCHVSSRKPASSSIFSICTFVLVKQTD